MSKEQQFELLDLYRVPSAIYEEENLTIVRYETSCYLINNPRKYMRKVVKNNNSKVGNSEMILLL